MKCEISVIVTVCNSEKFITKTLNSIAAQKFKDFETIIIDDGSTDSSADIVLPFCRKNRNFYFFSLPHLGISKARKEGIKRSKGKFISFIDSDDEVMPDFLSFLHKGINNSDICVCNYKISFLDFKFTIRNFFHFRKGIYFDKEKMIKSLILDVFMRSYFWNKLIKKSLLNDIYIPNFFCFEDMIAMLQIFHRAKKISVISNASYIYTKHKNNVSKFMDEKKLKNYIECFEFTKKIIKKYGYKKLNLPIKIFKIRILYNSIALFFRIHIIEKFNLKLFFKKILNVVK
jgi:glycosyltransferase involved in cell wall biosynthesis